MLDHLMRRPATVTLPNGETVRLLPLSPKALAAIGAEDDKARKSVMTVQLCVCGEDDRLRWGPDDIEYLAENLDAGVVSAIDQAVTDMFFAASAISKDPFLDSPPSMPDVDT